LYQLIDENMPNMVNYILRDKIPWQNIPLVLLGIIFTSFVSPGLKFLDSTPGHRDA
jgi:hypothetical protein